MHYQQAPIPLLSNIKAQLLHTLRQLNLLYSQQKLQLLKTYGFYRLGIEDLPLKIQIVLAFQIYHHTFLLYLIFRLFHPFLLCLLCLTFKICLQIKNELNPFKQMTAILIIIFEFRCTYEFVQFIQVYNNNQLQFCLYVNCFDFNKIRRKILSHVLFLLYIYHQMGILLDLYVQITKQNSVEEKFKKNQVKQMDSAHNSQQLKLKIQKKRNRQCWDWRQYNIVRNKNQKIEGQIINYHTYILKTIIHIHGIQSFFVIEFQNMMTEIVQNKMQNYKLINNLNPLQIVIYILIRNTMNQRSHLLMRSKQQLKNELLMGFRKKNKTDNTNPQLTQQRSNIQIYFTPTNNNPYPTSSFVCQNKSILDEFSKCPVREDEFLYSGQMVLNKFMLTKNKPGIPFNSAKNTVSVQTQRNLEGFTVKSQNLFTKTKQTNKQAGHQNQKTPPKVAGFELKLDKSILDVSGNLENANFPISENKKEQINKILTDSILGSSFSQNHQDSAQQLLRQLEGGRKYQKQQDQSFKFTKTKSQVQINQKKEPKVKKIQLNKIKSNKPELISPSKKVIQEIKENKSHNYLIDQEDDEEQKDQKIQKLLSKKNVIKSMILKKNQKDNKQQEINEKNLVNPTISTSKWSKSLKPKSEEFKNKQSQRRATVKLIELQQQIDPLDLLLPYQTSSSGLQAVIQEQNESEMQESVKPKNVYIINQDIRNSQQKPDQNQKKILRKTDFNEQIKKQSEKKQKQSLQLSIKQISLGDLSLEDVSEIQNASEYKKLPDSFKKMKSDKDINCSQLPEYQDSDQQNQKSKLDMHKYIVNDIANDIKTLKKKISEEVSFQMQGKEKLKPQLKKNSSKGSEGPDKKMSSMLDFFDTVHDKLNFAQISKDIIDLRDKIANQSQ